MIRIERQPEPRDFDSEVRKPGMGFLLKIPNPQNRDWKKHSYWRLAHAHLRRSYQGICAYCATWTPRGARNTDFSLSVDHFIPKSVNPKLAYEWNNYRLCRARLNQRKKNFQDVLDPFSIKDEWFFLDFTTFFIRPGNNLPDAIRKQVDKTISRLELNDDDDYVYERVNAIKAYTLGKMTKNAIKERYPFISIQMELQSFDKQYKQRLEELFKSYHLIP